MPKCLKHLATLDRVVSLALWIVLSTKALAGEPIQDICCPCYGFGPARIITNFTATGAGSHVVLSWHAQGFDPGTEFEIWRSIDGGATYDSCATNQAGQCITVTYEDPSNFTMNDYGVKNNYSYAYRILDSEGDDYWYMSSPYSGTLTKPLPPNPSSPPAFTVSDSWVNGTAAGLRLSLTLVGSPPHGTQWAHSYTVSYYDDTNPTIRTTTQVLAGPQITLGQNPLFAPNRNYHIKLRGNGTTSNTSYSPELHIRILRSPDISHAEVVAGTSASLQWNAVDWSAGIQYDVLYEKLSPAPPGSVNIVNAGNARVWNLSNLQANSVYAVSVRARDQWGNPSRPSVQRLLTTGISDPTDVNDVPTSIRLDVAPVPLRKGASTNLKVALPESGSLELAVYDVRGRIVRKVYDGYRRAGRYSFWWDGRDNATRPLAVGVYVIQLRTATNLLSQKLVIAH